MDGSCMKNFRMRQLQIDRKGGLFACYLCRLTRDMPSSYQCDCFGKMAFSLPPLSVLCPCVSDCPKAIGFVDMFQIYTLNRGRSPER